MLKKDEMSRQGCLSKADQNEMLFILRAQDKTAPKVVLHWIAKNFDTAPIEKLTEAFDCAIQMRLHKTKKLPD